MTELLILNFSNNLIVTLGNLPKKLMRVDLSNNKLNEMSGSFSTLIHLENLDLSG